MKAFIPVNVAISGKLCNRGKLCNIAKRATAPYLNKKKFRETFRGFSKTSIGEFTQLFAGCKLIPTTQP